MTAGCLALHRGSKQGRRLLVFEMTCFADDGQCKAPGKLGVPERPFQSLLIIDITKLKGPMRFK